MKVSEVMTRDVQTVSPDQRRRKRRRFMLQADAGSIPVTEGDRLIGMITDRDIAVRGIAKGHGPRYAGARADDQRHRLRAHGRRLSRRPRTR